MAAPAEDRLDPFDAAVASWIDLGNADSEDDAEFERLMDRARKATDRWKISQGWQPPEEVQPGRDTEKRGQEGQGQGAREGEAVRAGAERKPRRASKVGT